MFLFVNTGIGFFFTVEEGVAGVVEAFPHGIAHLVGDGTDLFPLGLECHEGVGGVAPIGAVFEFLGTFAQSGFLCEVVGEGFAEGAEIMRFGREEAIAGGAEALENGLILFAGGEADGLPLVLHADNELGHSLPFGHGGEGIEVEGFDLLAEVGLFGEVFFLFLFAAEEEVLVALIDGGGSGFEACPDFFALFFGYGTSFAKFLVQLLQGVESGDHIFVFGELFGRFAEAGFDFEVLFEIVGAHFMVDAQEIIELLDVVVEVFPCFGDLLCGNVADFLPFGLQGLETIVLFVDLFGLRHHLFDFLDDVELVLQVGLASGFGFCGNFGAHFLD